MERSRGVRSERYVREACTQTSLPPCNPCQACQDMRRVTAGPAKAPCSSPQPAVTCAVNEREDFEVPVHHSYPDPGRVAGHGTRRTRRSRGGVTSRTMSERSKSALPRIPRSYPTSLAPSGPRRLLTASPPERPAACLVCCLGVRISGRREAPQFFGTWEEVSRKYNVSLRELNGVLCTAQANEANGCWNPRSERSLHAFLALF